MKNENIVYLLLALGLTVVGHMLTIIDHEPHTEIIKHGCAEYSSQTGEFQWLKK